MKIVMFVCMYDIRFWSNEVKPYCEGDEIQEDETEGANITHGRQEKSIQNIGREVWKKETNWEI